MVHNPSRNTRTENPGPEPVPVILVTMANDPRRGLPNFGQHTFGERLGQVLHRCPDCPMGDPACIVQVGTGAILGRPGCQTCLGAGDVTEGQLAAWTARKNREATP